MTDFSYVPETRSGQVIQQDRCPSPSGTVMSHHSGNWRGVAPNNGCFGMCLISQLCGEQQSESKIKCVLSRLSCLTLSTLSFSGAIVYSSHNTHLGLVCLVCSCDPVKVCVPLKRSPKGDLYVTK